MNALVAVSNAHLGEFLDATLESVLRWSSGLVPLHGSRLPHDQASSPFTDVVVALKIAHGFAPLPRLHHFFFAMSVNIALSRLKSATTCFSFAFSSRSCFSSRA